MEVKIIKILSLPWFYSMNILSLIFVLILFLLLILLPPNSLEIAAFDFALVLALIFMLFAIRLIPRYEGKLRTVFIIILASFALLCVLVASWIWLQIIN